MSLQVLEGYAINQAKETMSSLNNRLKIAEDIREEGAKTLDTLHKQSEQIHHTHMMAIEQSWWYVLYALEPKKSHDIKGPPTSKDVPIEGKKVVQIKGEK